MRKLEPSQLKTQKQIKKDFRERKLMLMQRKERKVQQMKNVINRYYSFFEFKNTA